MSKLRHATFENRFAGAATGRASSIAALALHRYRRLVALAVLVLSCVGAPAYAGYISVNLSAGDQTIGSGWRTTTDWTLGNLWGIGIFNASDGFAAYTPYGNSDTTELNPNRMMWSCGADGAPCKDASGDITGASGPNEAFFGFSFDINPDQQIVGGGLAIIADDFFHLVINGQTVTAAILDEHKKPNGQPEPILLNFATLSPFFRTGTNVLAIRAMDGFLMGADRECGSNFTETSSILGAFCQGDRLNEYVYVSGSVILVPEPSTMTLWALGAIGLGIARRRLGRIVR